jgi:hypothetical protein
MLLFGLPVIERPACSIHAANTCNRLFTKARHV